jgi:hypothetical protein
MRSLVAGVVLLALLVSVAGADRQDPWESRLIRIGIYEFDTRAGEPMLPEAQRATDGQAWIVQLPVPVSETDKGALEALGVELYQYIPNNAFICRVPGGAENLVSASAAAVWIGRYHPAYKINRNLMGISVPAEVTVLGFPWADAEALVEQLQEIGLQIMDWSASSVNVYVRGTVDADRIDTIAALDQVYHLERWIRPVLHNNNAQWVMQTNSSGNRRLWTLGLRGQNQVISTSDSGIRTSHNMFRDPAVTISTFGNYPTHRKIIAYIQATGSVTFGDHANAYYHGTHTGGSVCGDDSYVGGSSSYDGMAYQCKNYFIDIGASNGGLYVPSDLTTMWGWAHTGNAGGSARIHSMSWGSDTEGAYSTDDRSADIFMWDHWDACLFCSAGNNPPNTYCGTPANSKSIVTVGACYNSTSCDNYCTWSAHGPTDDNRIKPDIVAPGDSPGIYSADGSGDTGYQSMGGTSMSSPIAASSGIQVRQYFDEGWYPTGVKGTGTRLTPSGALIKAIMINSGADDFGSSYYIPNNYIGWGRPLLDDALYFSGDTRGIEFVDNTTGLSTGGEFVQQFTVGSNAKLEVTLVWSDYRASTGADPTLVNDLDLTVTTPSAVTYRGNVYSGGESTTGGSYDRRNPVECVEFNHAPGGVYTVRVAAYDVPNGPQPFALAVTGSGLNIPVDLGSFDATYIEEQGGVLVEWTTQSEESNLGFFVLRSDALGGEYQTMNAEIIPGAGTSAVPKSYSFLDELSMPGTYYYTLRQVDSDGSAATYGPLSVSVGSQTPECFSLGPVVPNPSEGSVLVSYSVLRRAHVKLGVYDVSGRLVRTVLDTFQDAAQHRAFWDARDDAGRRVNAGRYVCRLEALDYEGTLPIVILK